MSSLMTTATGKLVLGYWDIRGMAQPIRYLMEYAELNWEDKLYAQAGADAPIPFDKSCWFDVKNTLGLSFPNLPYLIDGDFKLCQSQAILRHVARKKPELCLLGKDALSSARCDEIMSEYTDQKGKMTGLMYRVGRSTEYIEGELPAVLSAFENYLKDDWFAGDALTVADFMMFEFLDCAVLYSARSDLLAASNFPKLAAFKARFEEIPKIKAYLQSERFTALSGMNNQHAKFR